MIEFGKENTECGKFLPCVISCKELMNDKYAANTLEIVVELESGNKYKIIFELYMMYLVRNESHTFLDNYEIRRGNYFFIYEKSRLLDVADNMVIPWRGNGTHYEICAGNHVIDIITTNPPQIVEIHDFKTFLRISP